MTSSSSILFDKRLTRVVGSFLKAQDSFSPISPDELVYIPLKGGESQATLYRFDLEQRTYVLRLLPSQANLLTRKHQIFLAQQAGKIGIGPEVYCVDTELDGLIMEFIPGRTVLQKDFEECTLIAQFANFLQRLHTSKERFPVACSPFQRFHDFTLKGEKATMTYPFQVAEVRALMKELEAVFQLNPVPHVPCHLDLHPLNIMFTGERFFLVDWVNGGMSDPYFDLATFAFFLNLNESQMLAFLTHYFGRSPTEYEWNRLIVTRPIRLFVIAAALLSTDANRSINFLHSGLELVNQDNYQSTLRLVKNHSKSVYYTLKNTD